uniref:Uncharacterized protein n=1 Tax=Amphimedon queenslandica TaxID=400682 RepID=A0A1X7VUW6_AMPQE
MAARGTQTIKGLRQRYHELKDKDYGSCDESKEEAVKSKKKIKRPQSAIARLYETDDTDFSGPEPRSTTPSEVETSSEKQTTDPEIEIVFGNEDLENGQNHTTEEEKEEEEEEEQKEEEEEEQEEVVEDEEIIHNKTFKCCLPFCSKNITKNCRKCCLVGLSVVLVLLILAIAFLAVLITYPEITDKRVNDTSVFSIPPQSVVEVDLKKYKISTLKEHTLNISLMHNEKADEYNGDIDLTICRYKTSCSPRSINIPQNVMSFTRQWSKTTKPIGTITIKEEGGYGYVSWTWGNLTHPPKPDCEQQDNRSYYNSTVIDVMLEIYQPHQETFMNNEDLIVITFCKVHEVSINISECQPSPITQYTPIHTDNIEEDSIVLKFSNIVYEMFDRSKLYVNTLHLTGTPEEYQGVDLVVTSQSNIEVLILVIVGLCLAVLLLAITIIIIVCLCCCCKEKE